MAQVSPAVESASITYEVSNETSYHARAATQERALSLRQAYATVFAASACTLVIELLAGRLMAPYLGASLYTWTSVIGVVLAGMTAGNFVGGWLADKRSSRVLLSRMFLAAAATCAGLVGVSGAVFVVVSEWPVPFMLRIVLATTAIFFVPSFLLGTTTPQVVKLVLHSLEDAGRTVGSIYGVSAFGSIVGTFLTGFLLVDYIGTVRTLWLVSGILMAVGVLVRGRLTRPVAGFLVIVLVGMPTMALSNTLDGPCQEETSYFCIRTTTKTLDDGSTATDLILDKLVHTSLKVDDPTYLGYGYETVYLTLMNDRLSNSADESAEHVLVIGGGGYAFPRYLVATHPEIAVEVVEIDPGVVEFNHDSLNLPRDTPIVTHTEDARTFFNFRAPESTYTVVQLDAFNDVSVPYHLTTLEFAQDVKHSMTADGLFMTNLIDLPTSGRFVQAYANTLEQVFSNVTVYVPENVGEHHTTYVVVGSAHTITREIEGWTRLSSAQFETSFPEREDLILTDDYVPTDRLLRPVFDEANQK